MPGNRRGCRTAQIAPATAPCSLRRPGTGHARDTRARQSNRGSGPPPQPPSMACEDQAPPLDFGASDISLPIPTEPPRLSLWGEVEAIGYDQASPGLLRRQCGRGWAQPRPADRVFPATWRWPVRRCRWAPRCRGFAARRSDRRSSPWSRP